MQIYQLINYIVNIDYDIFQLENLENWEASLKQFRQELAVIENRSKHIIDVCIPALRTTKMGIDLMKSIKEIQTRPCLVQHILTKHESIIKKFVTEISIVDKIFLVMQRYSMLLSLFKLIRFNFRYVKISHR